MAKRKTRGIYHGYIVIDKPAGWTSHDVVGRVRRILQEKRVGHAGTLDPAAVGVLPVAVGLATRTVEYLSDASKSYVADVTFGVTTDSADIDGEVTSTSDAGDVTEQMVIEALGLFEGDQLQVPPMHSAIKVDGVRLYERARRGEHIEVDARRVTFHEISLIDWSPATATIFISCSKGTYIRSLARDVGMTVGPGAYMSNLVRVQAGPFTLEDAVRIDQLEEMVAVEQWETFAYHPDAVLHGWPALVLDAARARAWRQGKSIACEGASGGVRVYDASGTWLGVGQANEDGTLLQPTKVVAEE